MFGFINLNKPAGFTSHDCVAKLRKLLNTKKIGHGGTLDPAATGVLPIAVGKATRLLQFLPQPKAYRATIRLGITTDTDDLEGEVIDRVDRVDLEPAQIIDRLNSFLGTIEQVPPIYSAIKKNGKKLYDMARRGEEIVVEPRTIQIYKIESISIDTSNVCEIEVDIECSPGTYIRAIARDLGKMLGVGGTLANLIRTESCGMHLKDSVTFEEIESQIAADTFGLIEPSYVLRDSSSVTLTVESAKLWSQGQLVDLEEAVSSQKIDSLEQNSHIVTYQENHTLLGISVLFERNNVLKIKPKIVCISS